MSLLFLFPQPVSVVTLPVNTCFVPVATPTATWSSTDYDFLNLWSDWSTKSWGTIQSSGYTWDGLAGFTFAVSSTNATTWILTSLPVCT